LNSTLEIDIRDLLNKEQDISLVVEKILKNISSDDVPFEDRLVGLNFAINAGYQLEVFNLLTNWFENSEKIPWAQLVRILSSNNLRATDSVLKNLFRGAKEQELLDQLVLSRDWDSWDSRFRSLRREYWQEKINSHKSKIEQMLEKLEYFQIHVMLDEERKILDKLTRMFPDDKELVEQMKNFKERWAREIISKTTAVQYNSDDMNNNDLEFSKDEMIIIDLMFEASFEIGEKKPESAYNLCITFYYLGLFEKALKILELASEGEPKDWLRIELLYLSARYIDCLEEVNDVEQRYASDPESSFAAAYTRALALWELGQSTQAIELIKNIINVRPNYRSASSLLTEWSGVAT